jgi:hypothetical protein
MRGNRHYVHLAIMTALSFITIYILMYAMVNRFANVYSNLNQFYMAGRGGGGLQSSCPALFGRPHPMSGNISSLLSNVGEHDYC